MLGISSFVIFWNPIQNLQGTINQLAQQALGCSVNIEKTQFGLFLPRLELQKVNLPSGCLAATQKELTFETIKLYFMGLSLSPLGPVFKLSARYHSLDLPTKLTIGLKEIAFSIQEELPLESFSELIKEIYGLDVSLKGKIDVDFRAVMKNQQLDLMLLKSKGKEVVLEKAAVYGLILPQINLQDISIYAEGKAGKISLQKLILGRKDKDLFLDAKGNIKLPDANGFGSNLDVKVSLALGEKLLKEFSIIDMVLGKFKTSTPSSYQFSLKGDLAAPQLSN